MATAEHEPAAPAGDQGVESRVQRGKFMISAVKPGSSEIAVLQRSSIGHSAIVTDEYQTCEACPSHAPPGTGDFTDATPARAAVLLPAAAPGRRSTLHRAAIDERVDRSQR